MCLQQWTFSVPSFTSPKTSTHFLMRRLLKIEIAGSGQIFRKLVKIVNFCGSSATPNCLMKVLHNGFSLCEKRVCEFGLPPPHPASAPPQRTRLSWAWSPLTKVALQLNNVRRSDDNSKRKQENPD